jgi:hypothetical protein
MNLLKVLKNLLKPEIHQVTYIHCTCGNELCSGSFVSDSYDERGDNHVLYRCTKCGKESDFNFDIAPVPINWTNLRRVVKRQVISEPNACLKVTSLTLSHPLVVNKPLGKCI